MCFQLPVDRVVEVYWCVCMSIHPGRAETKKLSGIEASPEPGFLLGFRV